MSDALAPIASWFDARGWSPLPLQRRTWEAYLAGGSGLLHAPTGTGKTLAAWLGPVAEALAADGDGRGLRVLWLTPLRALANDVTEAMRAPLPELGLDWTVELRTGDTSSSVKARQRRTPPSALVTTPESLSVLLSYADAPKLFRHVRSIVVDEWHELLGSKRGVQTKLGLAAVRRFAPAARTWALSASLENLEEAAAVALGIAGPGTIISSPIRKAVDVVTLRPDAVERFPWSGHLGTRLVTQVVERLHDARTTLLFTNTRSQAEIWFRQLLIAAPDLLGQLALHHGSLDREVRVEVERRLRAGDLKAVVCTSSLDLGVDFPPVDQIVQIGSPKGLARLLQRRGAGHRPDAVSRVIGVPTNALEMIEFSAARRELRAGRIEPRVPLDRPLDVLAQHVVTRAMGGGFDANGLRDEVRSTHAYRRLTDEEWGWVLAFVERGEALGAYPQYRRVTDDGHGYGVSSPQIARLHRMSIGTITSAASMTVRVGRRAIGTIEESFISRLRPGDRFVFAGRHLELVRVRDMTASARPATGRKALVPRWHGGRSPLSTHLAEAVRARLDEARRGTFADVEMTCVADLLRLQARWSVVPGLDELLIESTSHRGHHHLFVFTLAGRLAHDGLSALVAHRIARTRSVTIGTTANDYGFELLTREPLELDEAAWRRLLDPAGLVDDLLACMNAGELQRRHFREIARVAGLVLPGFPGQPKKMRHLQASSDLFFDVFTEFDPTNLLLEQARREVLDRELEVRRLREALEQVRERRLVLQPTDRLSPLAFPLWAERLRGQLVSSEQWSERVRSMVMKLEAAAGAADAAPAPEAAP